jgi:drug/metabolite transporter (DMT)-like permease
MLVYHATSRVTSGLIAVVFSLIVVSNAFFERLFFRKPLERRMMLASALGVGGVAFLFWPEVSSLDAGDQTIVGIALATGSVVIASLGNMAAIINTARDLPVVAVNAHAMAWGCLSSLIIALLMGKSINFSFDPAYVLSLLYLAIFGSAIAFGAYLALLRLIGSARAAYTSVLFPIVALAISTIFEDYQWSTLAVAGVALIGAGNWLALTKITKG